MLVVGGVAVMVGVGGLGGSRPAPPWALTLALSRRAGEGTVVVLFGLCGEGELLDTDFRRCRPCEATHVRYDRYVNGVFVERVVDVVWIGDWEKERDDEAGEPAGIVNWD